MSTPRPHTSGWGQTSHCQWHMKHDTEASYGRILTSFVWLHDCQSNLKPAWRELTELTTDNKSNAVWRLRWISMSNQS